MMDPVGEIVKEIFSANLTLLSLVVIIMIFLLTQYFEEMLEISGKVWREFIKLMRIILALSGINSLLSLTYLIGYEHSSIISEFLLYGIIFLSVVTIITISLAPILLIRKVCVVL